MRLIRLSSKNPECWGHLPALREAIERAAVHFGQKNIDKLIERVIASFVIEGNPAVPPEQQGHFAVWYLVDEAGVIRGHLLAVLDWHWDAEPCVYINQVWAPHVPVDLMAMTLEELDQYGRSHGCRNVFMYTRRGCRVRWARWWSRQGFESYRVLARRQIAPMEAS